MKVNQKIKNRVLNTAIRILEERLTIRETAEIMNVSKSTVHKDVEERLRIINPELYIRIRQHLDYHNAVKHIRGGEATRIKIKEFKSA
nr:MULTISPECIES: sporulation transcriptional regulator SpoIIID [Paenibacillus]